MDLEKDVMKRSRVIEGSVFVIPGYGNKCVDLVGRVDCEGGSGRGRNQ